MPHRKKVILSALTLSLCYVPMNAQGMGGGGGCVEANIGVTEIISPLDFAQIGACTATAGTVTVDPNGGALTTTGCIASTGGAPSIAQVRVVAGQSSNSTRVFIRIPAVANIASGGDTMDLNGFALRRGGQVDTTVTQNGRQTRTYDIGGTLNVDGGQAGGTYTGSVAVSATCL